MFCQEARRKPNINGVGCCRRVKQSQSGTSVLVLEIMELAGASFSFIFTFVSGAMTTLSTVFHDWKVVTLVVK